MRCQALLLSADVGEKGNAHCRRQPETESSPKGGCTHQMQRLAPTCTELIGQTNGERSRLMRPLSCRRNNQAMALTTGNSMPPQMRIPTNQATGLIRRYASPRSHQLRHRQCCLLNDSLVGPLAHFCRCDNRSEIFVPMGCVIPFATKSRPA